MFSLLVGTSLIASVELTPGNAREIISEGILAAAVVANEQKAKSLVEEQQASNYVMKPQALKMYLDKAADKEIGQIKEVVQITSDQDMGALVQRIYTELPKEIVIKSDIFKASELKDMYNASESRLVADINPNAKGLANYQIHQLGGNLRVLDAANEEYSASVIKLSTDQFIADIVPSLRGNNELETMNNIYDWMFYNFSYVANNYKNMLVGNMYKGEMACNGFSYLADALFEEAGITTTIRTGDSHFWNVLTLEDGQQVTFDVTTDIVLGEYKKTLGASTEEHITITSSIGFYSAEFPTGHYQNIGAFDLLKSKK